MRMTANVQPQALAVGAAGLLLTLPMWGKHTGLVKPHVTAAQTSAMGALRAGALEGVQLTGTRDSEATQWWYEHKTQLAASRGTFVRITTLGLPRTIVRFTYDDFRRMLDVVLTAVRLGLAQDESYRFQRYVPAAWGLQLPQLDQVGAFDAAMAGGEVDVASLTPLGQAAFAAMKARTSAAFHALSDDGLVKMDDLMFRLAVEMDDVGYLIAGKPPEDPRIADAAAYAFDKSVKAAAGLFGDVAGPVIETVLQSKVAWAAGLAFIAWRVLR